MADPIRVLLVEDADADAELAADALERTEQAAFQVTRVRRLAEAERPLREEPADLVVLDLGLPDSVGTSTVERMCQIASGVPVVLLTGTVDPTVLARAVDLGASAIALKDEPLLRTFAHKCLAAVERSRRLGLDRAMTIVIESLPEAVVVVGDDGKVRFANQRALDLLDGRVRPGSELTLPAGGDPVDLEVDGPDGRRLAELRSAPLDWYGQPARLASLRDVTSLRELADRLLAAQKFEALGRLAGGMAHDFNNLLAVVLGTADRLLTAPVPEEKRTVLLGNIRQAAASAAEITGQLLTFTRTSAVAIRPLDLSALVGDIRSLVEPALHGGVHLVTDLAAHVPPIVADRAELQQVVLNLVFNARDAMPDGGRLEIATATADTPPAYPAGPRQEGPPAAGPYGVLRVSDTGEGMSPEVQARIFEPFFSTRPRGRGTGLGLATVHGVVSRARGFIAVDSAVGRGTTITVYLPAAAVPEPEQPGELGAASGTLLLVEDEALLRDLFRETLEEAGFEVLAAGSGEEALAVAAGRDQQLDLLVTDVIMPGMSGYELIGALRESRPGLPTIVITGYADVRPPDGAEPDVYLTKPITPAVLVREVRALRRH